MKKIVNKNFRKYVLTLFLAMCGTIIPVFSQIRYTAAVLDEATYGISNMSPCAIRHWRGTFSVAAANLGGGSVAFCLIDHTDFDNTFATPPLLPTIYGTSVHFSDPINYPNLVINDLFIVDNYAFFCGGISSGEAVYGYFDINSIYTISIQLYLYKLTPTPPNYPVSLQKLVAYDNGGMYDVVSFGHEGSDDFSTASVIVEIHDATSPNPNTEIVTMPCTPYAPYIANIFYNDIILTNSFVVLLGHELNTVAPISGISYPVFSIGQRGTVVNDILSNGSFYLNNPGESNYKVAGVALPNDQFAMSYVNDHGGGNYYTRLRVIDIPTMTNPYSQEFKKREKEYPVEMIYLSALESVEILQPVTDASNFIQMFPFLVSPYSTEILTPNDDEFKSLTAIDDHRFISARNTTIFFEDRTATVPHSSPSCPGNTPLKVTIINDLPPTNIPWGSYDNGILSQDAKTPGYFSINFKGCYSYE